MLHLSHNHLQVLETIKSLLKNASWKDILPFLPWALAHFLGAFSVRLGEGKHQKSSQNAAASMRPSSPCPGGEERNKQENDVRKTWWFGTKVSSSQTPPCSPGFQIPSGMSMLLSNWVITPIYLSSL